MVVVCCGPPSDEKYAFEKVNRSTALTIGAYLSIVTRVLQQHQQLPTTTAVQAI